MTNILVTGATGHVGSGIVRALRERGVPVRAFVRNAERAEAVLGSGVELAVGDFADPASVRRALEGMENVFLACANDPRQVEYECGVIEAAAEVGVRRVVKLSALGAQVGSPVPYWDWHGQIERHLWASGLSAAVLQPSFYMTNLLMAAEGIREGGVLFAPAAGARISMIDPEDVAAAAAAVLTTAGHEGQTYVLTGPEAITYERVAEELTAATGQRVGFVAVPNEAAEQALVAGGVPVAVARQLIAVFQALREGAYERVSDTVRRLTGHEPRSFAGFARAHAEVFRHTGDAAPEVLSRSGA